MNAFMALMIGIGNQAVSRMYSTWEKLPAKYKKLVQEFEIILVRANALAIAYSSGFQIFIAAPLENS